jgi:hypothetical protein
MTYTINNEITLAHTEQTDAFGRLRTSTPVTLFDSQNRYAINTKFYSNTLGTSSVTYNANQSSVLLNVDSTGSDHVTRETKYVFNYQPGKSLLIMNTFVFNEPKNNLVQRVGYFGNDNGYYIQLSGSDLSLVERSNSTGVITNNVVAQANWNGDKLDGTGASGIVINKSASQIFYTDIEWLGVGSVRTGVVIDGKFINTHTFHHANTTPYAYITTACLPIRYEIFNTGTTISGSNLKQICSTVLSEGGYEPKEMLFCINGPVAGNTLGSTTFVPMCTIRLAPGRLDALAVLKQINVACSSPNDLVAWKLILNGTLTNATYAQTTESTNVQVDIGATAISGGRVIETGYAQTGSINTSLQASFFEAQLGRNSFTQTSDTISLCVAGLTTNPKIFWSLAWAELN